jgi:hypothetical protein
LLENEEVSPSVADLERLTPDILKGAVSNANYQSLCFGFLPCPFVWEDRGVYLVGFLIFILFRFALRKFAAKM